MKRIRWRIIVASIPFFLLFQTMNAQQKQADGVLFEIQKQKETDPRWVKIQVCSENIIRVIAAPGESFSTRPSLMVSRTTWKEVPWSLKEKEGRYEISTPRLTVRVEPKTGAVSFFDPKGTLLLQENAAGGKSVTGAEVMGERTFHIRQLFDSPEDEAFYGLGAHQNGIMNYKGQDVDLWQHNIIDVIPFLVSSRNYGILWDNYSRTKFGDVREYQPLSSPILYNKLGEKDGLTVEYYADRNLKTLVTTKTEAIIEHEYTDMPGTYPQGFDVNNGSVRWSGEIVPNQTGVHKLSLYASGYVKMWLNGELVVDAWRQNWLPWSNLLRVPLEAGRRYPVKIEWIPGGGYIGLRWLGPDKEQNQNALSLYSEVADQIDYYFVGGENLDQVVQGYRQITGGAPMMPKWAMGFWQCRERYKSQDELLSVVREFRKRQIPLDNIVQDWFYWKEDQWGSHEFDPTRYPDPVGMVNTLHNDLHARIMISVWPKFYVGTKHYDEFKEKGWLYMHNIEKGVKDWVGPGYVSTFFDPFSEGSRDLYWKHINENIFSKGFDAWWVDATEPDLQSNVSPSERLLRMHPTALGTAARYENAFSLVMTKGIYENQRKTSPDQRVFILTRSAYAGQQRYAAATWSGDVPSRWSALREQIAAGLNFSLAGIPYWTTDIGGFAPESRYEHPNNTDLEEWRELNTRWFQFGAFCPLFRSHGQFPYREMFNIAPDDHPAFKSMLAYDRLRYRLMPYIYSLSGMVTQKDYTIMRALVMDFGRDKKVYSIGDQFMFGPALLVNPVTEYKALTRKVYLPAGIGWYDLKSGRHFEGEQIVQADAPYSDIPVFVKEGSILPCGPEIQYASEKPADPIRLFVYTGADGSFGLYEDEGVNYNYETGRFATIPRVYNEKDRVLTIGKRMGEFPGMLATRTFEIVWINKHKPVGLDSLTQPDATVVYKGSQLSVKME